MLLAICDDGPCPLVPPLILDGRQEVEEQLVPQPGLVQVGGVTRPRQDLGLGGAGQQSQVISRPEYGEESKNTCHDIAFKSSFIRSCYHVICLGYNYIFNFNACCITVHQRK